MRLLLLLLQATFFVSTQAQLNVSIYYESLCPDSIRFMTTQLAVSYSDIGEYLVLDFVPYGKVKVTNSSDGSLNYSCQHGPNECYGNRVQGCGIFLSEQDAAELFVTCVMGSDDPSDDVFLERCAVASGIQWDDIVQCMNDGQAEEIFLQNGVRTEAMDVSYVPTIVFNGVYNETLQEMGENYFQYTVCQLLEPKPAVCSQ